MCNGPGRKKRFDSAGATCSGRAKRGTVRPVVLTARRSIVQLCLVHPVALIPARACRHPIQVQYGFEEAMPRSFLSCLLKPSV